MWVETRIVGNADRGLLFTQSAPPTIRVSSTLRYRISSSKRMRRRESEASIAICSTPIRATYHPRLFNSALPDLFVKTYETQRIRSEHRDLFFTNRHHPPSTPLSMQIRPTLSRRHGSPVQIDAALIDMAPVECRKKRAQVVSPPFLDRKSTVRTTARFLQE